MYHPLLWPGEGGSASLPYPPGTIPLRTIPDTIPPSGTIPPHETRDTLSPLKEDETSQEVTLYPTQPGEQND